MKSDAPLDYAVIQLSPKRTRCELFVFSDGSNEKLASGLLKPFVAHLQIAEEQVASAAQSVKLEVGRRKNAEMWFTKGTLERFVRFVSTPEVLELVSTFDAEMSQLEAARRIYSQGAGDQLSGRDGSGVTAADDATKKELLKAIDVRLVAVRQDLSTACSRAAAAGFSIDTVQDLQTFADRFGAHRLNEACCKFISLSERRPEFINPWRSRSEDRALRSSYGSDMSIDDDPSSPPHEKPAPCQQANPPHVMFQLNHTFSGESIAERDDGNKPNNNVPKDDRNDESTTRNENVSIQAGQPARRLSVQDRISLFESKQKENSGEKPVFVKSVELKRLSSDLSSSGVAAEKTVLRRWSGASDMSIDLSADKRDTESPLCTPTYTMVQDKKVLDLNNETIETSDSKPETKMIPSLGRVSDIRLEGVSFNNSEQFLDSSKSNSNLDSAESDVLKDQVCWKTQSSPSLTRADDEERSEENCKTWKGSKYQDMVAFGDQGKLRTSQSDEEFHGSVIQTGVNNQVSSSSQIRPPVSNGSDQFEIMNPKDGYESRDGSIKQMRSKPTQKTAVDSGLLGSGGLRIREAFVSRYKGIEDNSSSAQNELKSVGETEAAEKKESHMFEKDSTTSASGIGGTKTAGNKEPHLFEKISNTSIPRFDNSGPPRLKFNRHGLAAELDQMAHGQRNESSFSGNSSTKFSGKVKIEALEVFDPFSTPPQEQGQEVRQSINQELNDDLKMKANELEKLFAQHILRVPGDQSNSISKGRLRNTQQVSGSLNYSRSAAGTALQSDMYYSAEHITFPKNSSNSGSASPMKTSDGQCYGDAISKKLSELNISECSRGKLYDRYMQKRDAKIREEWSLNRTSKEARLKSMRDSLERSRSEMKAKISGSRDMQDSVSRAYRRSERVRSYNNKSISKGEQQHLDFGDSEDDEEALDSPEQNLHIENRVAQGKMHLPNNRNLLSSTPRTSVPPVPRSATKISTIKSARRKVQPENPLGLSVPNFSDLRKENTKPSLGSTKTTHAQVRNHTRSKSISDESAIIREDNSCRSQSSRRSSANPSDFREMAHLGSDGVILTPLKFDEEVLKNVVKKPFLKKGSRTSFVAQSVIVRQKASVESELISNEVENDDMETESGPDELDEGEEEVKTLIAEDQNILYNGELKQGLELDKLVTSGTEVVPRSILTGDSVQFWPEESPVSLDSLIQRPFSYPHEVSDIDVSVDSPEGSPASWNPHSLNQLNSDTTRMRKKWGTAPKPTFGAHSSINVSRKDSGPRSFFSLSSFRSKGSDSKPR